MNIVICDDERYFVDLLELRLKKYAAGKDIGLNLQKCYSAQSLLSLDLMGCDAVFLDIDMPGTNGMEAAQALRKRYPKLILVFVTGWIQYAPAGYRVNAFRYLLKERLDDELLSAKGFLRLQKSYLANMEHIIKMKNYTAFLRNGQELKVSERQYAQIRKRFLLWKGHIL